MLIIIILFSIFVRLVCLLIKYYNLNVVNGMKCSQFSSYPFEGVGIVFGRPHGSSVVSERLELSSHSGRQQRHCFCALCVFREQGQSVGVGVGGRFVAAVDGEDRRVRGHIRPTRGQGLGGAHSRPTHLRGD